MDILIQSPQYYSLEQLQAIEALVAEFGEVRKQSLGGGLRGARQIASVTKDGRIIATGAIKSRGRHHHEIKRFSGFAGLDSSGHEMGYFAVHRAYQNRGLAIKIAASILTQFDSPLYATTRVGHATERMLRWFEFCQEGRTWASVQTPGQEIALWINNGNRERARRTKLT